MKRELKIIMNFQDEGIDCDAPKPINRLLVQLDGYPIGCIKELNLHATWDEPFPKLEFVFPDVELPQIENYIKELSRIPLIKIKISNEEQGDE